jgi:putative flippase GtrA
MRKALQRGWGIVWAIIDRPFLRFALVGGTGFLLNLTVTVLLTELVLGRERYFSAFLLGTATNITFNFFAYARFAFRRLAPHLWRRIFFFAYSIFITIVQLTLTKHVVDLIGVRWYALGICAVIGTLSVVNFVVFRTIVFPNRESKARDGG